jgi:extradiol dioxygenase family protein
MKKPIVADALTAFAEALENISIAPADVEVSLPLESWQVLARRLDEERTEKAEDIGKLEVGGVRYLIRYR